MTKIKTLTTEQINENPFITTDGKAAFYNLVRELFKTDTQEVDVIDCTKINVSKNIMDSWYDYAEKYNLDKTDLTMGICMMGPKAKDDLDDNTIEIQDGCFTFKNIQKDELEVTYDS